MPDVAAHNQKTYSGALVSWQYGKATGLEPAELAILDRVRSRMKGQRILDICVGGGRTTPDLLDISNAYIGIDYSPQMIERCRKRFPGIEFRVCDVRDLSRYRRGAFDFVFFSYNGIDHTEHDDRLKALSEIHRVLSPGGLFAFSSHNRASPARAAWSRDNLPLQINPFRSPRAFVSQSLRYPLGIFNSLFARRYERQAQTYELRNDAASQYSLISYYIHIEDQIRQLQNAGFIDCEAIDGTGKWLQPSEYADVRDAWVYYYCVRT